MYATAGTFGRVISRGCGPISTCVDATCGASGSRTFGPGATDSMFSIFMDSQIRNPYRVGMALRLRNRRQFDNPPSNHFHDER